MNDIIFKPEDHTYWRNGNQVPHVTGIIKNVGLINAEWFTPESQERGNYVHKASLLIDDDDLDWDSVPDDYMGYLLAYQKFLHEVKPAWEAREEIVDNPTYNYVGTLDGRGIILGSKGIVDLKAGIEEKWHRLQIAAYEDCLSEPHNRFCLYLRSDGTYKLKQYKDRYDIKAFRSSLVVSNWKGF